MPSVRFGVLTYHHQMGHHVWALGEEYAAEAVLEQMDVSVTPVDNATVPLLASTFAPGALVGARAILKFGTLIERRAITANTITSLTVNPTFSQSPVNDTDGSVQYQFAAECATSAASRFCIMERGGEAAGTLDPAGTWTPATDPVIEFCSNSNHDPDGNTQQETRNGDSCWEWIVTRPGYTGLTAPDPAVAGPASGFTVPDWIVLDKQPRFALMVDRSGSMTAGNKMADVRHGAVFWVEYCAVGDDLLSVVAYDDQIDPLLNLTQVSSLAGLGGTTDAIGALTPRGRTNTPTELGRHRAVVTVVGSPGSAIADPVGRLLHSKAGTVDVDAGAPNFVRQVVVHLHVGQGEKVDTADERPSIPGLGRPRRTALVSSNWTRRYAEILSDLI